MQEKLHYLYDTNHITACDSLYKRDLYILILIAYFPLDLLTLICLHFCIFTIFLNSSGFYIQPKAIHFTKHPNSQTVLVNSSLLLTCELQLSSHWLPAPEIHWYHDGVKLQEMGEVLYISPTQFGNSGLYHCQAIDGNAHTMSASKPVVSTTTISQQARVNVIGKSKSNMCYCQYQ